MFFTLKIVFKLKFLFIIMLYYFYLKFTKKKDFNFLQKKFAKKNFFSKSEQMRKNTDNKFYI